MRFLRFHSVFALSGAVMMTLAGSAIAQTNSNQTTSNLPTLQIYTRFAGQYDTKMGWRTDYGNPSVRNPMAEPTVAAGVYEGQTRLILGADNSIGQFYNALNGPDDIHNAQQDLASTFAGVLPSGFYVSQPQVLRDVSAFQLPGQPVQMLDRFVTIAEAYNPKTHASRIVGWATSYKLVGENGECLFWFNVNDSATNSVFADEPRIGFSENAFLITANLYSNADGTFQHAKLWSIAKANVYNDPSQGTCPAFPVPPKSLVLNQRNADGSLPFAVTPARNSSGTPTGYMVNSLLNGGKTLTVWVLDTTKPSVITGKYAHVSVKPYSVPPNAEQSGTGALINTWGTRISNAAYRANSGIWTVNTTACTPPGDTVQRSCLNWYELDPNSFTVRQQGWLAGAGYYYYAPAIAVNPFADAVVVFNESSANHYVGIFATGRYHTAAPNTMQGSIPIGRGQGCYIRTAGDNTVSMHTDATLDPIYSGVFWIHSAYVYGSDSNCQNNDWATGVAAVEFK